ncbi:hypothetical protein H1R20_g14752, partial [Candolleomyces eurysporus]
MLQVTLPDDETIVPHLIAWGYLPTTPIKPLVAISLRTLQFYKVLQQQKPSFSIEAFTKVLCDLYEHPYRRRWSQVFSNAFEVYLSITRAIDKRVNTTLNHCSENWQVLNACPVCMYELEGEPSLRYHIQISMDSNDLQKWMKDKGTAGDTRELVDSDYFIPTPEVDRWASVNPLNLHPDAGSDDEELSDELADAENPTVDDRVKECVKNWKATQSDTRKKVMGIFDETGWFACACRHGIILWVADMVQSGEQ